MPSECAARVWGARPAAVTGDWLLLKELLVLPADVRPGM